MRSACLLLPGERLVWTLSSQKFPSCASQKFPSCVCRVFILKVTWPSPLRDQFGVRRHGAALIAPPPACSLSRVCLSDHHFSFCRLGPRILIISP